jgi:LAO/AO transport system kinase
MAKARKTAIFDLEKTLLFRTLFLFTRSGELQFYNEHKHFLVQDNINRLLEGVNSGDYRSLAKAITVVENNLPGYETLLMQLEHTHKAQVVGITGPPGAGKSTLVNALLHHWIKENKKIAVIAVDPSSPFNYGAILGDRIRMSDFYNHPNVFIRSMATRGALGGLNPKIIEITDLMKNAPFDYILIETVGVGQSEVEIAGLADCTVVALVPEAGDAVQAMKAGIMEIANIFVVNKADREAAETMYRNLKILVHERAQGANETAVVKTVATEQKGIDELAVAIDSFLDNQNNSPEKRLHLLVDKSWQLMQATRMRNTNKDKLKDMLAAAMNEPGFNLYTFTKAFEEQNR